MFSRKPSKAHTAPGIWIGLRKASAAFSDGLAAIAAAQLANSVAASARWKNDDIKRLLIRKDGRGEARRCAALRLSKLAYSSASCFEGSENGTGTRSDYRCVQRHRRRA